MKKHVTETAITMVRESGLINLSRLELCQRSGISDGSFTSIMGESFTEFTKRLKRMSIPENTIQSVSKSRVQPKLRKEMILNVAVSLSASKGYTNITREMIANTAGVSEGLISHYFSTMTQLKREIMRYAIKNNITDIIDQGVMLKDKRALNYVRGNR